MSHSDNKQKSILGIPMSWDAKSLFKNLWNKGDERILLPKGFGIGWTVNLYALLRIVKRKLIAMKSVVSKEKEYLKNEQYKSHSNLEKRISIHKLFSSNPENIWDWVWKKYSFKENDKVLEVGCGTGDFWKNREMGILNLNVCLTDFSQGMLESCKNSIGKKNFAFSVADVESLKFEDHSFDAVISHFMLYHTSSKAKALGELCRVVTHKGFVGIVTIGKGHLSRIFQLCNQIEGKDVATNCGDSFNEEIADAMLEKYFVSVEKHVHEDQLLITDTRPLIDYLKSSPDFQHVKNDDVFFKKYCQIVQEEIDKKGSFDVEKRVVLYLCREPRTYVS